MAITNVFQRLIILPCKTLLFLAPVYNIYDECGKDDRRRALSERAPLSAVRAQLSAPSVTVETADSFKVSAGYTQALNDYTCGAETAMDAWLADPSVVAALHVTAGTPGMKYDKTATDLLPLYSELINKYQMLIYSGDTDGCVPYVGTEAWTRGLNFTVTNDWYVAFCVAFASDYLDYGLAADT